MEFEKSYATRQLIRSQNPLRRLIKQLYLNNILRDIEGPTIDFGCGAGQLLEQLPKNSLGLEINPFLVEYLIKKDLNVHLYNPEIDNFALRDLPKKTYHTFVIAHVLEHFDNPADILRKLFHACIELEVKRFIAIVPGSKGFKFDNTHKTFVNYRYIEKNNLINYKGYQLIKSEYFPINKEFIGNLFTFHESKFVYEFIN